MLTQEQQLTKWRTRLLGIGVFFYLTSSVFSHHIEVNEFDRSRPVELSGKIVKVEWVNPHPWIHLAIVEDDGTLQEWMVEAAAPKNLLRRGFVVESISPGSIVTVEGYQSKDGSNRANGKTLTYADGNQFFIGYLGLIGTGSN
tara:strand:- start:10413 stop:10841 length:429 start_codon:yes stop_codon:yes gene_type:complete